jgi:hypothetical protein
MSWVLTGHEELHLVLAGHARFRVDDDEIDGPPGIWRSSAMPAPAVPR